MVFCLDLKKKYNLNYFEIFYNEKKNDKVKNTQKKYKLIGKKKVTTFCFSY